MSILEDYDHDYAEIANLESDITKLYATLDTVEQYGAANPSVQLLCASNLLSSSSKLALESLLADDIIALEADTVKQSLIDTIKEKAADWSAKIITFFKDKGSSFLERITTLWDAFKKKLPQAKEKIGALKDTSIAYARTHPYKTIAAALAACASVVGIVTFAGRMLPAVTNSRAMVQFTNALTKNINAVRWPFGKVTATMASGGKRLVIAVAGVGAIGGAVKLAQLGWSKVTVEQLDRSLEVVCNTTEKAWTTLAPKVAAVSKGTFNFVAATAKASATGFKAGYNALIDEREIPKELSEASILKEGVNLGLGGLVATGTVLLFWASSILYGLYTLVSRVIGATIRLCAQTIGALSHPQDKEYV